jgi:uncharacterized protein YcfJ
MTRTLATLALGAAVAFGATAPAAVAVAQDRDGYYDRRYEDQRYDDRRYDDRRYEDRRYDDRYYSTRYSGSYRWRNQAEECRDEKRERRRQGAAVGAVAGAVLGSQVAARGNRTEGAVLGAVVGAMAGSEMGRRSAKQSSACDDRGAYWRRSDTYSNSAYDRQYGFDRYRDRRDCRWARDRWGEPVRVCAERDGYYRPF